MWVWILVRYLIDWCGILLLQIWCLAGFKKRQFILFSYVRTRLLTSKDGVQSHVTRRDPCFSLCLFYVVYLFLTLHLMLQLTSWYVWCHCWHKCTWTSRKIIHDKHEILLCVANTFSCIHHFSQSRLVGGQDWQVVYATLLMPWQNKL